VIKPAFFLLEKSKWPDGMLQNPAGAGFGD